MFLLVPAYPGCPGSKAVKRSLLLLLFPLIPFANILENSAFLYPTIFMPHPSQSRQSLTLSPIQFPSIPTPTRHLAVRRVVPLMLSLGPSQYFCQGYIHASNNVDEKSNKIPCFFSWGDNQCSLSCIMTLKQGRGNYHFIGGAATHFVLLCTKVEI